jgi:GntR family transcriptional regulator / MocR family aminotransferase
MYRVRTLPIALERSAREPLYRQIERQIRDAIRDGRLDAGVRLPGIRPLAEQLGTARITVANAYENLAADGYLVGRAGAGTRVAFPDAETWARSGRPHSQTSRITPFRRPRDTPTEARGRGHDQPTTVELDLRPGGLGLNLFPTKLWGRLFQRALEELTVEAQRPRAAEPVGSGDLQLRQAISRFVGPWRGVYCRPENLFILPNITAICSVAARAFVGDNGTVVVEDPGCPFFTRAVAARGARVIGVPVDAEGLDPAGLPDQADLLLVSPAWQYPLTGTMSMARRRAILAWAARLRVVVVEHDWAGAVRFRGAPLPALQSSDAGGRVIYAGSFLETVATVSIAYAIVPDGLIERFGAALGPAQPLPSRLDQRTLALFLGDAHHDRHLRRLRLALLERQNHMLGLLDQHLGGTVTAESSAAGGHLIVRLPSQTGIRAADVARRCAAMGVAISPLSEFSLGAPTEQAFVISYVNVSPTEAERAIGVLVRAIASPPRALAATEYEETMAGA